LWHIPQNNYEKKDTFVILIYKSSMKRDKNLKITPQTHKILKEYCEKNGLKMFAFVEKLIKEKCKPKTDIYGDELN
jgi:hypothetical protein